MSGAAYIATLVFFALAVSPIGALLAAAYAREFMHVIFMLYWIGGFGTAFHMVVVFGS